jgi:hypothetical protein
MVEMRQIPGFEPYLAGDDGYIYRPLKDKRSPHYPLKRLGGFLTAYGYRSAMLSNKRAIGIHVLVALAFHGPKPTPAHCIRHLDDNKLNNHPSNLAWGTRAENAADAVKFGTFKGSKHGRAYLNEETVLAMRAAHASGLDYEQVAQRFGVPLRNTRSVLERATWSHI